MQDALNVTEAALGVAASTGDRFYEAELHRLRAELTLREFPHRAAEAEAWCTGP